MVLAPSRTYSTYTGLHIDPFDMSVADVSIVDIAHALSLTTRFNGHCDTFYSVAQHSVLVSHCVEERCDADLSPKDHADLLMWALLHDAGEAYIGDVISPLKRGMLVQLSETEIVPFSTAERRLLAVIGQAFGLPPSIPSEVKDADVAVLVSEGVQLQGASPAEWWDFHDHPYGHAISPAKPRAAEALFHQRFIQVQQLRQRTQHG